MAAFDIFGSALGAIGAAGAKMWEGFDITNNPIVNMKIQIANAKQAKRCLKKRLLTQALRKRLKATQTRSTVYCKQATTLQASSKDLAAVLDKTNKIDGGGKTGALGKKAAEEAKKKADAAAKELADAKKNAANCSKPTSEQQWTRRSLGHTRFSDKKPI